MNSLNQVIDVMRDGKNALKEGTELILNLQDRIKKQAEKITELEKKLAEFSVDKEEKVE